jgi:hypothetical protein
MGSDLNLLEIPRNLLAICQRMLRRVQIQK